MIRVAASKAPRLAVGTLGATTGVAAVGSESAGPDVGVTSVHAAGVVGTGLSVETGQAVEPAGSEAVPAVGGAASVRSEQVAAGPEFAHGVVPFGRLKAAPAFATGEPAKQSPPGAHAGRVA